MSSGDSLMDAESVDEWAEVMMDALRASEAP